MIVEVKTLPQASIVELDIYYVVRILVCDVNHTNHIIRCNTLYEVSDQEVGIPYAYQDIASCSPWESTQVETVVEPSSHSLSKRTKFTSAIA